MLNPLPRSIVRKAGLLGLCLFLTLLPAGCLSTAETLTAFPSARTGSSVNAATSLADATAPSPSTAETTVGTTAVETTAVPTPSSAETSALPVETTAAPTARPTTALTAAPTARPTTATAAAPTTRPTTVMTIAPTTAAPAAPAAPVPDPAKCVIDLPGVPLNWPIDSYQSGQQAKIDSFLALINAERAAVGVGPLTLGPADLQHMAAIRAAEISVQFGHTRPTSDINSDQWHYLLTALHISLSTAGENLAAVGAGSLSFQDAFNAFKGSDGHYKNMISPSFKQIAIGVYTANGSDYYSQEFIG